MGFNFGRTNGNTGAAVAAPAAVTSATPSVVTSAAAAGSTPTKAEHDAVHTDLVNNRVTTAALVLDVAALRTTVAALQTSLHNAAVIG